ncbi:Mtx2/3 toxin-like protein [Listeria grandensis FSL F6-0971]|uniref:Mtx2/3 toxin-like protein n=1 Tax=Listeria grandensis FSL F6-0971 TaxID=1265819 RepID=W7BXB5_9LIST|nr:ETX/MTX2 family pore-forming toxin [Listeria grandensis]EUJ24953.1 Mtx2/3 toxin-like protein [Listeria grandensis FSL F6-0971]
MKKLIILLFVFCGYTIGITSFSNTASASSELTPALTKIDWIGNTYYKNVLEHGNIKRLKYNTFNTDLFNVSGTKNGEPIRTDIEPIYFGETSKGLVNNTDEEQTFSVPSFSKSVAYSKSTSISKNASFGLGKVEIPLLNELSATVNTSSTDTNTETETVTVTSPSQSVKVPAHKTYGVKVYLNRIKYTGQFKLKASTWRNYEEITATVVRRVPTGHHTGYLDEKITYPIDYAYYKNTANFKENGVNYSSNSTSLEDAQEKYKNGTLRTTLSLEGDGEYTIENGTDFHVVIYDMSNNRTIKQYDKSIIE